MSQQTLTGATYESPYVSTIGLQRDPETFYMVSLGGGVNSTAMLIKLIKAKLPIDMIIFADVGANAESLKTYEFLERHLAPYLARHGLKIDGAGWTRFKSIVDHMANEEMLPIINKRWCTANYKVKPIRRKVRPLMKAQGKKKLVQYLGIAVDEAQRMKPVLDVKYIQNAYPLVDWRIDRKECVRIIEAEGLPVPVKSSCVFCPFRATSEFVKIYNEDRPLFDWIREAELMDRTGRTLLMHKGKPFSMDDVARLAEKWADDKRKQTSLPMHDNEGGYCGADCAT